jgi:hypothetical protein
LLALLSRADGALRAYLTGSILKYLKIRQLLGVRLVLLLLNGEPHDSIPSPIPIKSIKYLYTLPFLNSYVAWKGLLS